MNRSEQKVVQYLKEARATELALVRVLQSQIAMTPEGRFREGLETHLGETRGHAHRLADRLGELQSGFNPILFAYGVAETVVGQAVAIAKTPVDLVRGTGGEEKVLKNAKDAAATEALEIATYTALERLATLAGDETTAALAVSIRRDEERMLDRLLGEIPRLTDAVYGADVHGDPSYDVTKTGAAEAARGVAEAATDAVDDATDAAKDAAAGAAGRAKATGAKAAAGAKGAAQGGKDAVDDAADAVATGAEKATDGVKDAGTAAKDAAKETVAAGAERVREAAEDDDAGDQDDDAEDRDDAEDEDTGADGSSLEADPDAEKPWAGYDELSVEEVQAVLLTADPEQARRVGEYELAHEARKGILGVVERHLPTS
jgi:ferritin-like metal-binding protein YciE